MATNEQDKLLPATLREIELQTQLGALQSQVTELHKAQDTAAKYPKLLSEDQNLKDRLGEHSKLLEESTKNLSQFEAENLSQFEARKIKLSTRRATSGVDSELRFGPCSL